MDAPVSDRTLRRYLAGALDPGRREEIEAALAASPRLGERLALLVATTVPEPASAWRLPPPGARGPWSLAPAAQLGAAMGEEAADLADWLELRFRAPEGCEAHRVIVLERAAGADWEVIFPTCADEELPLSALPREADGRVRLDLAPAAEPRRVAVALLAPEIAIAWEGEPEARWAGLREALAEGRAPVETATLRAGGVDAPDS